MEKQNQVSQELRGWSPPRRTDSLEPKCLGSNPGSAIDYLCDLGKLLTSLGLSFSICKMGLTKQGDRHIVFRAVPDNVVLVVPSQSTSHPCYIRTGLVQRKEKGANLGVSRRHSKKEVSQPHRRESENSFFRGHCRWIPADRGTVSLVTQAGLQVSTPINYEPFSKTFHFSAPDCLHL